MGFWDIMSTFGSLYSEYYKGKSIEDLCRDINHLLLVIYRSYLPELAI